MKTTHRPLLLVAVGALALAPAIVHAQASAGATIEVTVRTKHDRGRVRCALHSKANWLEARTDQSQSKPKDKRARCTFEDVPSGRWAVAVHHDEDGDGQMKTNVFGIPSEGYGFSRNASAGAFGPPGFDQTSFRVGEDTVRKTIDVRY